MNIIKRIFKNESGFILPTALVLLILGGLLVVPSLYLMQTTLKSNQVVDTKTKGIYAADAGIEDALWKYMHGGDPFADGNLYTLNDGSGTPVELNGMTVTVEVTDNETYGDGTLYTVVSKAWLGDDPEPKAVITAMPLVGWSTDFSWLFDHAITSAGDIELSPGDVIYGDVICSGDFNDNGGTVYGDINEGATIVLPTEAQLTAHYLSSFSDNVCADPNNFCPDNPYGAPTYPVTGGTLSAPYIIPWLYCSGDLEIAGDGYAQLGGNIFVNGKFELSDKDVTLDLNGHTIYATENSGCEDCDCNDGGCDPNEDAIYFGQDSKLVGPGCVIGVGNINFQPSLGQGRYLLGADNIEVNPTYKGIEDADRIVFSRFETSNKSDTLASIQVLCEIADPEAPPSHLKVAIYEADGDSGGPGTLMAPGVSENITFSTWAPVSVPPTSLVKSTAYWLAAVSDASIIVTDSEKNWSSKYKISSFEDNFLEDADGYGTLSLTSKKYMLRGFTGGQEFIMLMSLCCTTNLQPSANFYGTIVGNTTVNLQPGCFINLVGVPEGGLDFPGVEAGYEGEGEGESIVPVQLLTYSVH